jgi:hypothetical protein
MRPEHATFPLGEALTVVSPLWDSLVILNSTARMVWEMLAQGQPPDSVIRRLIFLFGIPEKKAREDVGAVVRLWSSGEFPNCSLEAPDLNGIRRTHDELEQDRQPISQHFYALSDIPFCIRFHSAEIESILQSVIGHIEKRDSPESRHAFEIKIQDSGFCLLKDDVEVGQETLPHRVRHDLIYEISKISYPDMQWLIFLHAGAVSDGERGVVLPGLPGCGKSTLTGALTLEGFRYIGEDIVPLSRRPWSIAPVPTRICLREGGWLALSRDYPDAQALPGGYRWGEPLRYLTPPPMQQQAPHPVPINCLVFPEYVSGHSVQLNLLSSEDKLARLIQTGAWFSDPLNKGRIEELLEWIQSTPGFQLRYATLHDAVTAIRKLMRQ